MKDSTDYISLVRQAQLGDRQSLNALAEMARGRLYTYVYRIVLRDHITQDIIQETMLEMFKILGKLENADKFWPWLCRIAYNKMCRHFSAKKRHKTISLSEFGGGDWTPDKSSESEAGLASLVNVELKQIVFGAMRQLKPEHRTVLTMRCYEQMPYSQIAELMQCSELSARVLFCRAKKSLQKQLSRSGFRKEFLLAALILFGKMTAPSEAVAAELSVAASALEVGATAGLVAMATSQATTLTLKTVAIPLVAAGGFTVGTMVAPTWVDKTAEWATKATTAIKRRLPTDSAVVGQASADKAGMEYWYYYPDNADGPVMMRLVEYDSHGRQSGAWLQDDQANYYFDRTSGTVYISNHRMYNSDLSVKRLPTDSAELAGFLSTIQGRVEVMESVSSDRVGLLVITRQSQSAGDGYAQVTHHYNVLDEEYFRYNWPAGAEILDNRDAMHQRGWTYFTIDGHIDGQQVSGAGRIPFVYAASEQYYPWLRLNVAGQLKIIDDINGTRIYDKNQMLLTACLEETAFKTLARPWMGLHAIDTVRRDAAKEQIKFETRHTPPGNKARVILTKKTEKTQLQLVYTIDLEKDVIDKITFSSDSQGRSRAGELRFSYLQKIDRVSSEFAEPREKIFRESQQQKCGTMWLLQLAEGSFD